LGVGPTGLRVLLNALKTEYESGRPSPVTPY
jgi:hypothetical protein